MGRKAKYSYEQKVQACEDYLSGHKNASQIAREFSMAKNGERSIRAWAYKYKSNGPEVFLPKKHNQKYTKERFIFFKDFFHIMLPIISAFRKFLSLYNAIN